MVTGAVRNVCIPRIHKYAHRLFTVPRNGAQNAPRLGPRSGERSRPDRRTELEAEEETVRDSSALTLDLPGRGEVLAVFCHPEEAEVFLWLGPSAAPRRPREASAAELVSVLSGPRAGVGWVALNPLPERAACGLVGLVSLRRERFSERFVGYGPEERLERTRQSEERHERGTEEPGGRVQRREVLVGVVVGMIRAFGG